MRLHMICVLKNFISWRNFFISKIKVHIPKNWPFGNSSNFSRFSRGNMLLFSFLTRNQKPRKIGSVLCTHLKMKIDVHSTIWSNGIYFFSHFSALELDVTANNKNSILYWIGDFRIQFQIFGENVVEVNRSPTLISEFRKTYYTNIHNKMLVMCTSNLKKALVLYIHRFKECTLIAKYWSAIAFGIQ